ncbi:hypothetical protein J4411_01870 [Candidatus Pacearchaeota archaeon]|nr:hypothetical protein [Candidatus Pacearchaeota archaeon]
MLTENSKRWLRNGSEYMPPEIKFWLNFETNFSAFVLYLFEEFSGCTKDALIRINQLNLKKEIEKVKDRETFENNEKFVKKLSENPFVLKKRLPLKLFEQIYFNYRKYYFKNKKLFKKRAKEITSKINRSKLNRILKSIENKTKIPFKPKRINVWLVDIYYIDKEKSLEGTATKEGIYLGLPSRPVNLFYSTLIHELVHHNLIGKYSEDKEEILAQLIGLDVSKIFLGKVPLGSVKIAKRRVERITKMNFKTVLKMWENKNSTSKFINSIN